MTENEGFTETAEPEQATGEWLSIAFMGHNEYTGYVTEIVRNGQPFINASVALDRELEQAGGAA